MLIELLSTNGYIAVNKLAIKKIGLLSAVMLGELCSEHKYWSDNGRMTDDKFFYSTRQNIECKTGMSAYQQREALKKLVELGIIETAKRGNPCKTFYRINEINLYNMLNDKMSNNLTTSSQKTSQQDVKKFDTNNNRYKETISTTKTNREEYKEIYNSTCSSLPKVIKLTKKRKDAIKTFEKELTLDQWKEICEKAQRSNFLTGKNDNGWQASFDFLIRPDKAMKTLEGTYDGKGKNGSAVYNDDTRGCDLFD